MNLIKRIQHFFNNVYLRYLLVTELYIVEPWEKVVVHVVFALLFALVWMFNYSIVMSSISTLRANWREIL